MSDQLNHSPYPSPKKMQRLFSSQTIIAVALMAFFLIGTASVVFFSLRSESTEDRSKAAVSDAVVVRLETTQRPDAQRSEFTVVLDGSGLRSSTQIREMDFSITVGENGAVLGATTRSHTYTAPGRPLDPTGNRSTKLCLTAVQEDTANSTPNWRNPCKGDPTLGSCTGIGPELSGAELTLYDAWKKMGKPERSACFTLSDLEATAMSPEHIRQNYATSQTRVAPSSPQAQTAPVEPARDTRTPPPQVRTLLDRDGVQIQTSTTGVQFDEPNIEVNQENNTSTIHIKTRVASQAASEQFSTATPVLTLSLPWGATKTPLSGTLSRVSVLGAQALAPNTLIELAGTPTAP